VSLVSGWVVASVESIALCAAFYVRFGRPLSSNTKSPSVNARGLIREVPTAEYDAMEAAQTGRPQSFHVEERSNPNSDVCVRTVGRDCDGECNHCLRERADREERDRLRALPIPAERQTVVVEEDSTCVRCYKPKAHVSEYPDGAQRSECHSCGNLTVLSPEPPSAYHSVVVQPSGLTWVKAVGGKCAHGVYVPANRTAADNCATCSFHRKLAPLQVRQPEEVQDEVAA
jgi:hypothetical protein